MPQIAPLVPLLSFRVAPPDEVVAAWPELADRVLLAVAHGAEFAAASADLPLIAPPNRVLAGPPRIEVWLSHRPVVRHRCGDLVWSEDGQVLFGALRRRLGGELVAESEASFRGLLELLDARGYPNLLRVWNLLPEINAEEGGVERYRLFNLGRSRAFEEHFGTAEAEQRYPASTAVGTTGDQLLVWFAASRFPGTHLENPRQDRAYRYPPAFGPKAPSFSRATVAPRELGDLVFLSGTASIVGCESRHRGCVRCQIGGTLTNIDSVFAEAAPHLARPVETRSGFGFVRVYVRHRENLPTIRDVLAGRLDPGVQVLYLEADICRAELLLEIEGVALPSRAA